MEAAVGIEPTNKGFADLCLTTWLRRLTRTEQRRRLLNIRAVELTFAWKILERETGFEPATSTLARSHSTAELLPPEAHHCNNQFTACQCDHPVMRCYPRSRRMSIASSIG